MTMTMTIIIIIMEDLQDLLILDFKRYASKYYFDNLVNLCNIHHLNFLIHQVKYFQFNYLFYL